MEYDLIKPTQTQIAKNNELIYLFKCNPFLIKCIIDKQNQIEFRYCLINQSYLDSANFTYLTRLNTKFNINLTSSNIFNFFLLKSSNYSTTNKPNFDKSISSTLDANLYNIIFQSPKNQSPILLIGSNHGYLYWQNLNNTTNPNESLNDFTLINASSPIIYINSFKYNHNEKHLYDALFKSNINTTKNTANNDSLIDNCLFIITKSARIYLFAYTTDYIYKNSILPHYIDKCFKYNTNKKSFLIYTTQSDKNVYSIDLDNLFKDKPIKPTLIKRNCLVHKFQVTSSNLFALTVNRRKIQLELEGEDNINPNYKNNNIDTNLIKSLLNKICSMSNNVVKTQLKLDKLNIALKQFNHLQQIKLSESNDHFFQVDKKFTQSLNLEVKITNKLVSFEDYANKSSYMLFTSIQMNGLYSKYRSYNWKSKSDNLSALKPNMSQLITFDLSNEILNNHQLPCKIIVYLVFDVNNFIDYSKFDFNQNEQTINDYCICISKQTFKLSDFFDNLLDSAKSIKQFSCSISFSLLNNSLDLSHALDSVWNNITLENVKSNNLKLITNLTSITNINSNLLANLNFNLSGSDDYYKLSLYFQNYNSLDESTLAPNIVYLIYLKNEFILPLLNKSKAKFSNNYQVALRVLMDEIEKLKDKKLVQSEAKMNYSLNDIIDDSIKMDEDILSHSSTTTDQTSKSNEDFYSMETLIKLFEIYLKLRNILYTNIKLY